LPARFIPLAAALEDRLIERIVQAHASKLSSRLLEWIRQNWNGNGWENYRRLEILFDESGNPNGQVEQDWSGTDWVATDGSRLIWELDTEGYGLTPDARFMNETQDWS